MLAAESYNWLVFELCLEKDASLSPVDHHGQSVLHKMCDLESESEACRGFRLLVKHRGQDILNSIKDAKKGNTALHRAAIMDKADIVDELIILGASPDIKNFEDRTVAETIIYGPELFERIAAVIYNHWVPVGRALLKHALLKKGGNMDDIEKTIDQEMEMTLHQMEEVNISLRHMYN